MTFRRKLISLPAALLRCAFTPTATNRAIKRIATLICCWAIPGVSLGFTPIPKPSASREAPNVILILADDLGIMDTGIYGATQYSTPNIDKLAQSGVRFTQAYTNAGNCAPSRASLMTGMTPPEHGILTVGSSARGNTELRKLIPPANNTELNPDFLTIADLFKSAGYHTAVIGKWHLGNVPPEEYGFDHVNAASHLGHPPSYYYPYSKKQRQLEGLKGEGYEGEYLTDRLTREAIDYVQSQSSPFFLYLPFYAVHTPIEAPAEQVGQHLARQQQGDIKSAEYAAMVTNLDANIGKLMAALTQSGKRRDTLVIFASDNGGYLPVTSSLPYRGAKSTLFEGGIRTPLLLSWPGKIQTDSQNHTPVQLSDLFEAVRALLFGIQATDNLLSLAQTQKQNRDRALFWHAPVYMQQNTPFRNDPAYPYWKHTPASAIRMGNYKLIHNDETGRNLVFDLSKDPGEQRDLADTHPQITATLYQALEQWLKASKAPLANRLNPEYNPGKVPPQQIYQSILKTTPIRD